MLRGMPAAVIAEDLSIEYETFGVRLGVLTALGISRAHVVGSSMGGMIAQTIAIEHPERVLTLTSMMSTTGEPEYGQSAPEAMTALLTPPPADREGYIEAIETSVIWRPGARLLLLKDMGHDRPEPLWPRISDAILEHTQS
jgi:pimeloyl-ACP methyl ester carboxylesterase